MAKRTRNPAKKKPRKTRTASKHKPPITRYEYAQLCLQLARVESLVTRNRTDLDIQLRRIAQVQDELEVFKRNAAGQVLAPDALLIPIPKTTIES
jgi:hypothetical protein